MSTEPLALQSETLAGLDLSQPTAQGATPATTDSQQDAPAPSPAGASALGAPQTATATPAPTGDDWRTKVAGEDKAFLKTLDKYTDPSAFGKAHRALLQRLSTGELKPAPTPYPDKGTPAEQMEWRKTSGIPEAPEGYAQKLSPPPGVVFGENDKPGLDRLYDFAYKNHWPQDQVNGVVAAYHHELQTVTAAREQADMQFHSQSEDMLRADWGADFTRNLNATKNMLAGAPEGVRERLMGGRTADGRMIGDDPAVLKWLGQVALDLNPAASILPPSMTATSFKSRLDTLNEMAKVATGEYYQDTDAGKALQREHFGLIAKEGELRERGKAA